MNWLKNNHAAVITGAIFCLGFAIFWHAAFSNFISYDAYWHLKMGQDLIEQGISPRVDHYSFTFPEQPILSVPYFFQVVLSLFVSGFGSPEGFQLLKIFSFSLFMLAIYFYYREIRAPWQIIFITLPYIFVFLLFRFNHIRPEIFDNVLVVIALTLYLRASKSFSHRNLAFIAVLQLFWVNYHAPILGYVIFFGLFLDKSIDMLKKREDAPSLLRWASWGFVIFIIGFVNPDLSHQLFSVLRFSNEWAVLTELTPTNELSPNSPFFYVFWLVSGYIAISLVMQRQYGFALVCAIFAFQSWQAINVISISGVVVICLLAFTLSNVNFAEFFKTIKPNIKILITVLGVVAAASGVFQSVTKAMDVNEKNNDDDFPRDVASYLKKNHPQGGNIFNRLRDGGFLIYHLSPEFKVYIDGRTNVLYPVEFLTDYATLYSSENFESIADEIEHYNIEFAIYPIEMGWFPLTDNLHALSAEYVSKKFILLSSRQNNFPLSARVMYFPMCWQQPNQQALSVEYARGKEILPADSVLLPVLEILVGLANSANPYQFFNSIDMQQVPSLYQRRLLGYAALELRSYQQASAFFQSIGKKDTLDLLMLAHASTQTRNFRHAEELLLIALSDEWALLNEWQLSSHEQAIAVTLLENLKTLKPLPDGFEARLAQLRQSLRQSLPSLELPLTDVIPKGNCSATFAGKAAIQ